ncbi:ATP-dependent helicase [Roseateles sp.]|uniref:ATP-dependent helicase n=1 Tax=Roseateles sp. TaxID=1971397 RepID=UPI0032678349
MSDAPFQPTHITPSDEQLAIQLLRSRLLLVEANAGAAKTTTLALRIAQALQRGAPPATVLALTSTAPAVQALRERLAHIGVPKATAQQLRIQTFEAFSLAVLATFEGVKTRAIASHEQVKPFVVRAIERAQLAPEEPYPDELMNNARPGDLVEGLLKSFDVLKGRMVVEHLAPEDRVTPALADELGFGYFTMRVWQCYEFIRKGGHPDHPEYRFDGDGSYDLARLLTSGEIAASDDTLDLRLSLVCVDEMHDVNRAAFTVLKAVLAANPRAAFVGVGDRDQVIHAQTGAEASFMDAHFKAEIGMPQVLPLTQSRRFSPQLARHMGKLARKPYAADEALHTDIHLERCETSRLAAEFVARQAQAHHQQKTLTSLRVLLRHAAQSVLIEHELLRMGVPYGSVGFAPYLERPETLLVRGLYAYARHDFTGFEETAQRVRLLDALLMFSGAKVDSLELRHLDSNAAQRAAVAEASTQLDSTHTFIEAHVLRSADPAARRQLDAALAILRSNDFDAFEASFLKALDPLQLAARVFVRKDEAAQVADNVMQLHRLAEAEDAGVDGAFRMFSAMDKTRRSLRASEAVVLSSIEAAKGLEFDHVLIPHLSQGEFGEGSTENRNLLYVAMTRARRRLTLTFDPDRPSRFLKDAGLI